MALREAGRFATITASGGGTLTAKDYESLRITDIFCVPSSSDTFLILSVDGVTIGKLRVKGLSGNHLPYPAVKTAAAYEALTGGLFAWLRTRGIDLSIPVAKGQTLTVARYAEAGEVTIKQDVYDAGDVKDTEPNGRAASKHTFLHYMTNAAALTATPAALDTSLLPTGWGSLWPVGGLQVPGNTKYRLLGVFGCPVSRGNASANKGYTTHLALIRSSDWLWDESQVGVRFLGDAAITADAATYTPIASVVGPLTAEYPYPPLMFPALELGPGETLTPQVVLAGAASGGIAAGQLDVALLLERTFTGK